MFKKAMTVLGPFRWDELGHTLPHEHIFVQQPETGIKPMYPELMDKKVSCNILGKLRRDVHSCRDNLRLDDADTAERELASFKSNGGGTLVDVTCMGMNRHIDIVTEISKRTGIHIIAATGYYTASSHPNGIEEAAIDHLCMKMVRELTYGIDDTSIKAGIIGEIGVSSPMQSQEEKVLRAAARASNATGAPIAVHQKGGKQLEMIDKILTEEKVEKNIVMLCHMCAGVTEIQRIWAAGKGYYVGIDSFGHEYYNDASNGIIIRDPDKIQMVKQLIEKGYLKQVLISNNISMKMLLKKYGGWGYEHIKVNIVPFMHRFGIPIKYVDTLIYYNPMRFISYLD